MIPDVVLLAPDASMISRCSLQEFPIPEGVLLERAAILYGTRVCCPARRQAISTLLRQELWNHGMTLGLEKAAYPVCELPPTLRRMMGCVPPDTRVWFVPPDPAASGSDQAFLAD